MFTYNNRYLHYFFNKKTVRLQEDGKRLHKYRDLLRIDEYPDQHIVKILY